jgi:tetratricopeptide (TPR) repeat protein
LRHLAGSVCFLLFLASSALCVAQSAQALAEKTRQAALLVLHGQFPAAIEAYQNILMANPHDEKATLGLAAAYRGIFNYDETQRLLHDAEKRYPKSALALVELGKLDIHLQHYDEAVEHLTQAVRRQPGLSAAHEQLGVAYQAKGDEEKALQQFEEAIRLNPDSASAHYFRGSLYADRDDFDRAYRDALQAHKLEPNPQSAVLLAKTATHVGKCDEAVALLKPLAEPESYDPANLYLLSAAYKCSGQPDLAQATLADFESRSKKAQEIRTQAMEADHLASQAGELARKNQLAAAMDLIDQALQKDPENAPTHALLAKIEFSRKDVSKASEEITRALQKDPYNPDYLYVSGKVLEMQADTSGALQAFQRTVLVNPKESDAYYEIARIYLRQGRRLQAIQALKKAIQLSPDDPDYKKALAELDHPASR